MVTGVTNGAMAWAANYGFAAVIAIMFWRYITTQASENSEAIRDLEATLNRVEKTLDRLDREHNDNQ